MRGLPAITRQVEEIRVALALNGGVSLAVWMGGCAVELDCARRAHLGPEDLAYEGFAPAKSATQVRTLYNALCAGFARQLVPDVLSGASAGGVNGALLGAAMTARRRLHPEFVRRAWLELGDFSRLLHPATEANPRSLMQGKLFFDSLVTAFEAILGDDPNAADAKASALPAGQPGLEPLVPKLEVTMTDVYGVERTFRDECGGELVAREHRACFSFAKEGDYTAKKLATAARASASFPVAFEPWKVDEGFAELAGLAGTTYAVDGGLLDNAPIKAALDLIPGQRTTNRVRRYACYLNADPPRPAPPGTGVKEPGLDDVVGYVVNLPRLAPFVDQLYAVERAGRRASLAQLIQPSLLRLPLEVLLPTAGALLGAYRRRQAILTLQKLTDEPADAAKVLGLLDRPGMRLPWIPETLDPPDEPAEWAWGVRPAQRVLHLVLDLIRPAIDAAGAGDPPASLVDLRERIGESLARLDEIYAEMRADEAIRGALRRLATLGEDPDAGPPAAADAQAEPDSIASVSDALFDLARPYNERSFEPTRWAIESFHEVPAEDVGLDPELRERLFGETGGDTHPEWGPGQHFLARALAIEVLRRALGADADVDSAEPLHFVQLTPSAPTPILNPKPGEDAKPVEPRDKLTGVGLGHFAGFYRGSWRINDFMWGRLDASARIVEMLLDGARWQPDEEPAIAKSVAAVTVPSNAGDGARWLVHEALEELAPGYELGGDCVPDADQLRAQLESAIATELAEARTGAEAGDSADTPLIRVVCTRAAQLEILQDELPVLVEESAQDHERGSSSPPLELPLDEGMQATIEALQERAAEGKPLPRQLDDSHEEVSDLGLRTITHTAFVSLSAARAAGAPLARFFGLVRAPLQAVSGSVSSSALYRATVAMAFWAAALYLTLRFATTQPGEAPLSVVWSRPVLVSLVAALAVLGVVLVPALRAVRGVHVGANWLRAAGLAAVGGLGAALLARYAGDGLTFTNVVFATGSEQLPDWLLGLVLVTAVGLSAVRLPVFGSAATTWLASLRAGWRLCGPLLAVSAAVAATSIWRLWPLLGDSRWETIAAALALFAAPVAIVAHLLAPLALSQLTALRRRLDGV